MKQTPERDEQRLRVLGERYLGTALIGLAVLLFWSIKLILAEWIG